MATASPRRRPVGSAARMLVVASIVAACGSAVPSPASGPPSPSDGAVAPASRATARPSSSLRPSPTPPSTVAGVSWSKAASVERPDVIVPAPMPSAYHHPGHFEGQAYMSSVAPIPGGGFVAVGYEWPGWHALTWRSADGSTWRLTDLGERDGTFMNAVAVGPSTIVAVGRDNDTAAVWTSADGGASWVRVTSSSFQDPAHLRMDAVAAVPGGFLAGGSAGPDIGRRSARLWSSPDGRSWTPLSLPGATDARVTGIASGAGRTVVVGTRGTEREPGGSVAWVSEDQRTWAATPSAPELAAGLMVAVAAGGPGFVAVGTDGEQYQAMVWRSADGVRWERISSPTFAYHDQKVRMTAVVAGPAGPVAVGNYLFGTQYGFARVWTASPAADDWAVAPEDPSFGQGEMLGVAADGSHVVAVGTFGAPDNYVPTVWISPPVGP